ncbi:SpoIIE family protein phosphatase [Streptomyces sp. NPDC059479]|uniref:ATP-binding SpoIIE family protein phosphatase n=1 Tax=Streptomyces sp. NPDC059479 TaxID=3346848 RepID=UPI0036A19102
MRTEDVLSAIATGLWRWDNASGTVTFDAEAARLLGLPAEPVVLTLAAARARFHPVDWIEINSIVHLAIAEHTLAEARLRIMDENGRVLRTVRSRARTVVRREPEGPPYVELYGTIQEVAEVRPGTAVEGSSVTGDWRRSREAFLLDAGRALAEARSTAEVLRVAASLSMPGFSPDGLAVFGVSGERLTIIGHHGHDPGDAAPFEDMRVDTDYPAAEVVRNGRAIYLSSPEAYRSRYPAAWQYVRRFERRSWAYLPLVASGRTLGCWMAGFKHRVAFSPDERSVLTTVARMLAQALARASLAETERELSLGLQRTMMPTLGPEIPGMTVAARYVPTGGGLQIGGDWYDMIPLPGGTAQADGGAGRGSGVRGGRGAGGRSSAGRGRGGGGRFALVIGDVQGHDVRAAGLMGQLRVALRAYASEGHRPDAVLSRASRFLAGLQHYPGPGRSAGGAPAELSEDEYSLSSPRFATCLYLEVDPESGTLDIARAGHPDPVIRTSDGTAVVRQTAGGLPLGIEADSDYPTTRLDLEPGETLMLCTDGLIETGGHDLATGWARLRPVLEEDSGESLEKLADALVQAVHGPTSHYTTGPLADRREDDIALLLLSRDRAPARGVHRTTRRTALTVAQAEPERVAGARRQVRDLLHDWASGEQIDSAELMVSEMLTNVLVHTDNDALLLAEAIGEQGNRRLRVEVADTSDELPHRRRPGELASSGRGLVLMEMLADAWGVDPRGEGKSIWFELYECGNESPDGEAAVSEVSETRP